MELTLDTHSHTFNEFIDCEKCNMITLKLNGGCRQCGDIEQPDATSWHCLETLLGQAYYLNYRLQNKFKLSKEEQSLPVMTVDEILKDFGWHHDEGALQIIQSELLDVEQMTNSQAYERLTKNTSFSHEDLTGEHSNWKAEVKHNLRILGSDGTWQVYDG